MLLDKYIPKKTKDIIGNQTAVREVKKFLAFWRKGQVLLVHGPPGCGKTTAVRLIAKEQGYDLVELEKPATSALGHQGVFSKKRIILFDLDALPRNFLQIAKDSSNPVVCVIDDAYKLNAAARKSFRPVKFSKIQEIELMNFLNHVCTAEGITRSRRDLEQIARTSNGDIRAALIDLEMLSSYRDAEDNVFNTLRVIFKTSSIENARLAVRNSEKDSEELFHWLEQNIVEEYTDLQSIATAYNYLSIADLFQSRILRRQSWSLQKYFSDLSACGTALAKTTATARQAAYRPPIFVRRRGDAGLQKLANNLHTSRRCVSAYVPLVRTLMKRKSRLLEEIGMDESEIAAVGA